MESTAAPIAQGGASNMKYVIGGVLFIAVVGIGIMAYKKSQAKTTAAKGLAIDKTGAATDANSVAAPNTDGGSMQDKSNSSSLGLPTIPPPANRIDINNIGAKPDTAAAAKNRQLQSAGEASVDAKDIAKQIGWMSSGVLGHTPKNNGEWGHALDVAWSQPSSAIMDLIKKLNDSGYILTRDKNGIAYPIDASTYVDSNAIGDFSQDKIYKLQNQILQKTSSVNRG